VLVDLLPIRITSSRTILDQKLPIPPGVSRAGWSLVVEDRTLAFNPMINGRKDCEGTAGWLSSQGLLPLLATPIMDGTTCWIISIRNKPFV
jgi:hypothetical protein